MRHGDISRSLLAAWVMIACAGSLAWAQAGPAAAGGTAATAAAPASSPSATTTAASVAVLLEKGIYTEETAGDIDAAIKIYKDIIEQTKANRTYAAQAQYRLALCYVKKKQSREAMHSLQDLVTNFADQKELAAQAAKKIGEIRQDMSAEEIAKIVNDVVTDISTMADGDARIGPLLQSLRELKEPAVIKELIKYFDSDKNTIRRAAIYVIWKGGFTDPSPAVPALIKLCSHDEDLTRGMAAIDLGALKVNSAFQTLADMAGSDKSPMARMMAVYALGLMGDQRAKPILEKALKDSDKLVANNAEAALTMLGKAANAGGAAPHIIKSSPADFANDVDPKLDKLSVTFDQKMIDGNWSWVQRYADKFPKMTGKPSYDKELKTNSVPVSLEPGRVYYIEFNSPPYDSFMSQEGHRKAARHALVFATATADGKPTPLPEDLVKQAKAINDAAAASSSADKEAMKAKLINWVEKFFSENYRDITARKTIEWGEPQTTPSGNLSITYKYLATIWNKDKIVSEQRFTFAPDGKFVSAETIEKGPASQPASGPTAASQMKAKLINWVEKFFSENYRDITARKTIEWGEPQTTPSGNLSITYKYLATIWNKEKIVSEQRFTFAPDGKFVSAETIEKGPASQATIGDKKEATGFGATGNLIRDPKDSAKWQIDALVNEADILKVAAGQRVDFTLDALPRRVFKGNVIQVWGEPVRQQNIVCYQVTIQIDNPDTTFKLGMTANVWFPSKDQATSGPTAASRAIKGK